MGIDKDLPRALFKALQAANLALPQAGRLLVTVADKDKTEALPLLKRFAQLGFSMTATDGTARLLAEADCPVRRVNKIAEGSPHVVDLIRGGQIDMVLNTLTKGKMPERRIPHPPCCR